MILFDWPNGMSTVYRLPERSGSFNTRDGMTGGSFKEEMAKDYNCCVPFYISVHRRSMPWKSCGNRVLVEEAIPRIVTEPGRSSLGAQELTKTYLVLLICPSRIANTSFNQVTP